MKGKNSQMISIFQAKQDNVLEMLLKNLDGTVSFCAGAIVRSKSPGATAHKIWKKVEAGTEFIQTQAVYDLEHFKQSMKYPRQFPVKILMGVILLTSLQKALFMNKKYRWSQCAAKLNWWVSSGAKGQSDKKKD